MAPLSAGSRRPVAAAPAVTPSAAAAAAAAHAPSAAAAAAACASRAHQTQQRRRARGDLSRARAAMQPAGGGGGMGGGALPQQYPSSQPQQLQLQPAPRAAAPLAALAPRGAGAGAGGYPSPQQPGAAPMGPGAVFLDLAQVLGKPVITRTSGRALGTLSACWVDPGRRELVSFDLDDRGRAGGSGGSAAGAAAAAVARPLAGVGGAARVGNLPLAALRQIGDVVLVHDESGLYEPDLDGRLGFVNPLGLEVRTAAGELLGRVRDVSFSPDTGALGRVAYDEFGLPALPAAFFDCYSVGADDVLSIGRTEVRTCMSVVGVVQCTQRV